MTVSCRPRNPDRDRCPYIRFCFARMADRTITGCGLPLYMAGMIDKDDIMVEHTVGKEKGDDQGRVSEHHQGHGSRQDL